MDRIIQGDVYYQFINIGNSIKVIAIDEKTGVEISLVGSRNAHQSHLQQIAYQKLEKKLKDILKSSK